METARTGSQSSADGSRPDTPAIVDSSGPDPRRDAVRGQRGTRARDSRRTGPVDSIAYTPDSGAVASEVSVGNVAAETGAAGSSSASGGVGPVDSAAVRRANLGRVLRHIAEHGPCARTEVAAATGLAHGSVTALVGDLIERGLVGEDDVLRSGGRGRPGRPLRLIPKRALAVAVQITSEHLRAVVADLSGAILWRQVVTHNCAPGTPEAMADAVAAAVGRAASAGVALDDAVSPVAERRMDDDAEIRAAGETLAAEEADAATRTSAAGATDPAGVAGAALGAGAVGVVGSELVRVVIAMAGPVRDDAAQTVAIAPDFGWFEPVRLGELVAERLPGPGCPVDVINDGNAAAFAEYHARPQRRGLVLIEAGTGIGGGVVLNGRIQFGSHGVAGEPGHIPVALDGPECVCGARGCLVLYAGPEAVLTAAGFADTLRDAGSAAATDRLAAALRAGEERALAAVEVAARALSAAMQSIHALLDVEEIVLGGTLAEWFPWMRPTIEARMAGRRALAPTLESSVGVAVLGADAMLHGAVEFARRTVLSDPSSVSPLRGRPAI